MKYKKFTSASEMVHKKFFCKEFALDFSDLGVDFKAGTTAIEMKCKKRYRKTVGFICKVQQVEDWETMYGADNLLWLFMLYDLDCLVGQIRNQTQIESHVLNREFWLLPWSFIKAQRIKKWGWGDYYWLTNKDFPVNLKTKLINGTFYHYQENDKITELFERREFLIS